MQRNILARKNNDVDEINNAILESVFEGLHAYLSANFLTPTKEGANAAAGVSMYSLYPVEFLNTLQFGCITNHKLELKVGVSILLLSILNQSIGLCNGTRLVVKRLGQRVIEAEIITGNNVGKRVFIPRIIMSPSGTNWLFVFRRRQFLVRVAFAITINKSQVKHWTTLGYICCLQSIPTVSCMLLFHGSQVVQTSRFSTAKVSMDTCKMSYIKKFWKCSL